MIELYSSNTLNQEFTNFLVSSPTTMFLIILNSSLLKYITTDCHRHSLTKNGNFVVFRHAELLLLKPSSLLWSFVVVAKNYDVTGKVKTADISGSFLFV